MADEYSHEPLSLVPNPQDDDYFWRDFVDKKSGRTFFVNLKTGIKTWRKPENFIEEMDPPSGLPPRTSEYEKPIGVNFALNDHEQSGTPLTNQNSWNQTDNVWQYESGKNITWTMPLMGSSGVSPHARRSIAMAKSAEMMSSLMGDEDEEPDFLPFQSHPSQVDYTNHFQDESDSEDESDFSDPGGGPPMEAPPPGDDPPGPPMEAPPPGDDPPAVPMDAPPGNDSEEGDSDFSDAPPTTRLGTARLGEPSLVEPNKMISNVIDDVDDSDEEVDIKNIAGAASLEKSTEWFEWSIENWTEFPWIDYAKHHFRPEVKGYFSKRLHKNDVKWAKKLNNSLMDLEDEDIAHAKKIFLNITKYCGDRKGKKEAYRYIEQTLASMLGAGQALQDETYALLVKQTNQNPCEMHPESKLRAWRFLAICCGIFPPSQTQVRYLVSYIRKGMETEDPITKPWCEYALKRLDSTMRCGRRKYIPLKEEILCAERMQPIKQEIFLLDGTAFEVELESQDRVDDTLRRIRETLELNCPEFYGLFEMQWVDPGHIQSMFDKLSHSSKNGFIDKEAKIAALRSVPQTRFLEESDRILDIVSGWKYGQSQNHKKVNLRIVLQVRLVLRDEQNTLSVQGQRLHFIQSAYNIHYGYYAIDEKIAWELAALRVQCIYGEQEEGFFTNNTLISDEKISWKTYLPYTMISRMQKEAIETKILTNHGAKFTRMLKSEAYRMYASIVTDCDHLETLYGSQMFPVVRLVAKALAHSEGTTKLLQIYISENGLSLVDPFKGEAIHHWPLSQVLTYGYRRDAFFFIAGSLREQKKFRMATYFGKQINDLLLAYVNLEIAKYQLQTPALSPNDTFASMDDMGGGAF